MLLLQSVLVVQVLVELNKNILRKYDIVISFVCICTILLLVYCFWYYSPFHCGNSAYQRHSLGFAVALPFFRSYHNYKTLTTMPTMPFQLFIVKTNYFLQVYLHLTTSKVVSHPFSSFTWNFMRNISPVLLVLQLTKFSCWPIQLQGLTCKKKKQHYHKLYCNF